MKRLIYIVVACILFSIILHAQRIPRWFEVKPNYFATAIIYDVDSITFDKFYGDEWTKGYIALRSPAIAKKDTIWILFDLVFFLDITKQDFYTEPRFQMGYKKLPGPKEGKIDSIEKIIITQELCRIFSKDIIFRNTTFDEAYMFYEKHYQKLYMPDSTQSKQLTIAFHYPLFLVPPAEKATETLTETKQ